MWPLLTRRQEAAGEGDGPLLLEVFPSRREQRPLETARELFSSLAGLERGLTFEVWVGEGALRFYVRGASEADMAAARAALAGAAPLVDVEPAARDPLEPEGREEGAVIRLAPRPGHYPVGRPLSREREQAPPALPVLGLVPLLAEGERAGLRVHLSPPPAGQVAALRNEVLRWETQGYREAYRMRVASYRWEGPASSAFTVLSLMAVLLLGLTGYMWWREGNYGLLALEAAGLVLVGLPALMLLGRVLGGGGWSPSSVPTRFLEEKLRTPLFRAQLEAIGIAPARERAAALARAVARSLASLDHPMGGGIRPVRSSLLGGGGAPLLAAHELAQLWHLPADAPSPRPVMSRPLHPSAEASPRGPLSRGPAVGVARHQGREVLVRMPEDLVLRHNLVVARTRRGKSTFLLHVALYVLREMVGSGRASLLLVDPHGDLARMVLGALPPEAEGRVVALDFERRDRVVGINLLDVEVFPERDRTAENIVTMLQTLWPEHWGPRMEGALRAALMTLHMANQTLVAQGRAAEQYTLLDVVPFLMDAAMREDVTRLVPDLALHAWWRYTYDQLGQQLKQQTANPVTTKVGRFMVTEAARYVLGQPRCTVDPAALVREGRALVLSTSVGRLGEGGAALLGTTFLNLMARVAESQAELPPEQRRRLIALVDESAVLAAADFGRMLGELGKYGLSLFVVTQSLDVLRLAREGLLGAVVANCDGITAFAVSAHDAEYLARELGAGLRAEDLADLEDYRCYCRWWSGGRRLPTFSLRLLPPPPSDPERAERVISAALMRYGLPLDEVAREVQRRIHPSVPTDLGGVVPGMVAPDLAVEEGSEE